MTKIIDCKPNEIIAVDPDVLVNYDQLEVFMTHFGFKKAKFIARIPNSWASDVSKNIINTVKKETDDDSYELSSTVDALNITFNATYAKCDTLYELTDEQRKLVEVGLKSKKCNFDIAIDKKIVNLAVAKNSSANHIAFEDIRKKRTKFKDTEEVCIREVSLRLNEPDSIVNQQVRLFERIIDYNDEISLIDRYLHIKLNENQKIDFDSNYNKFMDKLFKKIGSCAEKRACNKTLNIYLDQTSGKNHSSNDLEYIKAHWLIKYKSLFEKGMVIKIFPFIPNSQDTHDRWFIGHDAGGWGCLRGAKDTYSDELNFFTITNDTAKNKLNDYDIKNNRIKLDFGLVEPIVISKHTY